MTRAAIHLGNHSHPVSTGMYRDFANAIQGVLANAIAIILKATNSAIALAAVGDFLSNQLYHSGEGEKTMLQGAELEVVMDRFHYLSSPSICNEISSLRSNNRKGVIDNIMTMKRLLTFDFIHDSVFLNHGKEKVYLFKMFMEGSGSGVDLVKRMQVGRDMELCWMMFDHVKRVQDWTTMAYHVYDAKYKKVVTIATCNMQFEDTKIQFQFWKSMKEVTSKFSVKSLNFKGFMADSAIANWRAVRIVFGSGSIDVIMDNCERTCLLHWSSSLHKYTQKYIKEAYQEQDMRLCKQYKDSVIMEDVEVRYLAICSWWLLSGAADADAASHLDHWLEFWHFCYK